MWLYDRPLLTYLEACLTVSSVHPEDESIVLLQFRALNDILLSTLIINVMAKSTLKKDNKRNKHSIFCWISIGIYLFTDLRMWSECCRVCSSPLGTCSSGGPAGSRWIVKLITNSWKENVNHRKFHDFIMCKIVEYKVKYCIILRKLQIRWFL